MTDATIAHPKRSTGSHGSVDAPSLALHALAWIVAEPDRASRFLALTGLTPDGLRAAAATPAGQQAVIDFLVGHEADLIACAAALDVTPDSLAAARP